MRPRDQTWTSAFRERVVGFIRRRDVVVVQKNETMVAAVEAPRAQVEQAATLISAAPDLLRVVEKVEWAVEEGAEFPPLCPACYAAKPIHLVTCALAAALKKARGEA